jgi:ribokinase
MSADTRLVVVGSLNMDIVIECDHIPLPGETILGVGMSEYPGGKGGNQAVAAARLGGPTAMIGCLGHDPYSTALRAALIEARVDTAHVLERGPRGGVAIIEVAASGENSIVVVQGANALLTAEDVESSLADLPETRILLLQLEIPIEAVERAAQAAGARGMLVLLDPAPARTLSDRLLGSVDYLTPNQQEAAFLAGMSEVRPADAPEAARRLLERGVKTAIIKLGAAGVYASNGLESFYVAGHQVETVDTTAAGDCFAGALAVALLADDTLQEAVAFANAAAALSTTGRGAQPSMPTMAEVRALLRRSG